MTATDKLLAQISEANLRFTMFSASDRVLVGFSGGADSLTLLDAMHSLLGRNVYAFHVNHMLRGDEADADELFCRRYCEQKGIPFNSERIDVAALARMLHGGGAIEETARDARYAALLRESERVGAAKIALAHTASDNAETVIFNLARGTALAGLRGIPPKRIFGNAEIIRPLILCTREEIERYCDENALAYRTDATNADVHYRRNFIRHRIIPEMRELNPALHKRIGMMCESLRCDEDFINGEAYRFLSDNTSAERRGIPKDKLLSLHRAVRTRVIAAMFARESEESLEEKHYADVEGLLACGKDGARIILPGKTAAVLQKGELFFIEESKFAEENEKLRFRKYMRARVCDFGGMFSTVIVKQGEEDGDTAEAIEAFSRDASFSAKVFLPESVLSRTYIRNRENGDKYVFGGMTRTLKKLLSGKTETAKKKRPVFCDEQGIFWFPGFRLRDDVYAAEEKIYALYYFEYEN